MALPRLLLLRTTLIASLFAGCATRVPRTTSAPERPQVIVGLCEDYPEEARTLAKAREDLAAARAAGATVLRIAFGWDAMEPQRGTYDWSFWDEFLPLAVNEYGLKLIPYICYTPQWATDDKTPDFWRSPPRNPEDFARFVRTLVGRYAQYADSWELWNEPDNRQYWTGTPKQFAALIRAGSKAVRAADPSARVVLGGIAGEVPFLQTLFRDHEIARAVDVVNVHNYFETWHPHSIEQLPEYLAEVAETVRRHGENEPIWLAEAGYSSIGPRAYVSSAYQAVYTHEHTAEAQANALARLCLLAFSTQRVELLAWYRINDLPAGTEVIGDKNNLHLGLRAVDGHAKPAYAAFARLASLFRGPYEVIAPRVEAHAEGGTEVQVHAFRLADGRVVVGAWLAGQSTRRASSSLMEDGRHAIVRVWLPGIGPRSLHGATAAGAALPDAAAALLQSADATGLRLELRGPDVVVCELIPAAAAERSASVSGAQDRLSAVGSQ